MQNTGELKQSSVRLIRQDASSYQDPTVDPLTTLERRLADGYARIDHALSQNEDVTAWEDFWIDLLHQYEAAVDCLPVAA